MRKISQLAIVFSLLLSIFSFTANAQDINNKYIMGVASNLQKSLEDPFEKLKLANDIKWFFENRVKYHPNRYENEEHFQTEFKGIFTIFVSTLYSKKFSLAETRLSNETVQSWVSVYADRKMNFEKFYSVLQSESPYYIKKPISEMIVQIIQFAIILNESGEDALIRIRKITGIWPFC